MAKRSTSKKSTNKQPPLTISIVCLVIAAIYMLFFYNDPEEATETGSQREITAVEGTLQAHFIDVGQGDSTLLIAPDGECMLIDAGPNSDEEVLKSYLESVGVKDIEYAVFTHPHEDHIGGADTVINNFNVKNVILPDVTHTTTTYEKMINAIDNRGCSLIIAEPGSAYSLGSAGFKILGPVGTGYESLNDYSVVLRFDFGGESIMFSGDAEVKSEKEMLAKFPKSEFESTIHKIGHHCSTTSSCDEFLDAVDADIGVIFCKKGNDYGHPHKEVYNKLIERGIEIHRTDEEGTVVLTLKGEN